MFWALGSGAMRRLPGWCERYFSSEFCKRSSPFQPSEQQALISTIFRQLADHLSTKRPQTAPKSWTCKLPTSWTSRLLYLLLQKHAFFVRLPQVIQALRNQLQSVASEVCPAVLVRPRWEVDSECQKPVQRSTAVSIDCCCRHSQSRSPWFLGAA